MAVTDGVITSLRYNGNWLDQKGSNNGTPSGAVIDTSFKHLGSGSSLFDGFNDLANFGNDSSFDVATIGFSLWMYNTSTNTSYLLSKRGSGMNSWYCFVFDQGRRIQFGVWTLSGLVTATTARFAVGLSAWYNIICTYDGTNMRVYIDDILKAKVAQTGDITVTTADVVSGAFYDSTLSLTGNIDQTDIREGVWTYDTDTIDVAAGGEIAELYNGGAGIEMTFGGSNVRKRKLMEMYNA